MGETVFQGDRLPNRLGTGSIKWDLLKQKFGDPDLLPLWVADMDFPAPPCIVEAVTKAAELGIYGYYAPSPDYQDSFLRWEKERHGVTAERSWLAFSPGVVTAIYRLVQVLTEPGDAVCILTPCYYPFMDAVRDTGRTLVCSELVPRGEGYTLSPEDLERTFAQHQVKLMILCSPHNPVGHVWTEEELRVIVDLCVRYDAKLISDEIHQDIVYPGHTHCSMLRFPELYDRLAVVTAPSKTFNIAGMQNSFLILPHPAIRKKYQDYTRFHGAHGGNLMGYIAAEAGYRDGGPWLDELLVYLKENDRVFRETLTAALPLLRVAPLESTYMVWVDLSAYVTPDQLEEVVQKRARLAVDYGSWFWPEGAVPPGEAHIRVNIATSRENIRKAAQQLIDAIRSL